MTATVEQFLGEVEALRGTPFVHQGRVPGVGIDCVGVGIVPALRCGLMPGFADLTCYPRDPTGQLRQVLDTYLVEVPLDARRAGDVLVFAWSAHDQHIGILLANGRVMHSWNIGARPRVIASPITGVIKDALTACYRFPAFCDEVA